MYNILLTSAGRRGYLVEYFKQALGKKGHVHAGNSSLYSPAFYYGDARVVTPLIYDDNYIPFLLDYCKKNEIKLIVPLFDIDLCVLAKHKKEFQEQGVTLLVSDEKVTDICNDKWKTYCFCKEQGFLVPDTCITMEEAKEALNTGKLKFPLIIKPRWGMGSIGVMEAENMEELEVLYQKVKKKIFSSYLQYESAFERDKCVLIQQRLDGCEYGLDVIHNMKKEYCLTVVKEKLAMRSGETDCAKIVENPQLEQLGKDVGAALGHIGNLDMDVFLADKKPYVLEMNARFGGGYPFTHMAGVNLVKAVIQWEQQNAVNETLEIKEYGKIMQKDIQIIDITEVV